MECQQLELLTSKLNSLLEFLQPFLPLVNSHFANFITNKLWNELPDRFQKELFSLDKKIVYEALWKQWGEKTKVENFSEVSRFLSLCWEMSLDSENCDFLESYESLLQKLDTLKEAGSGTSLTCSPHLMSLKKAHEVEIFGSVVATAAKVSNAPYVVDLGGGKGYLGTVLALHQNLKVLSIDSSQQNTIGALKLSKKMEDVLLKKDKSLVEKCNSSHFCKNATIFISPQTNLSLLLAEHFPLHLSNENAIPLHFPSPVINVQHKYSICVAGLHTCGDLASSSLQLFCTNNDIVSLCSVGCCYNLMSESLIHDSETNCTRKDETSSYGFPLSNYLQERRFVLGRNARMLAAQALHRIAHNKLVMPDSLFYRTVLQVCLTKTLGENCTSFNVGRVGTKVKNLEEYLSKSQQKLNVDLQLSEDAIKDLIKDMNQFRSCMEIFYIMRLALAPVVEAVILFDRLLYLHEKGVKHVFLAKLFDPIVSPRCVGIIAFKS